MKDAGKTKNLLIYAVLLLTIISCTGRQTVNYYFDPVSGNDSNNGTSPRKPFKSLSVISRLTIRPGDSILLKGGAIFKEPLDITCCGSAKNRIVIGKYGPSSNPVIEADGKTLASVHVLNSEYIVIRDLEITNDAGKPVAGLNGLWLELSNYGTAKDITIENIFVHNVTGSCTREENDGGHAIYIQNYHENAPDTLLSCFDSLTIQNCHIKDCSRSGIIFWGNWVRSKWKPSTNVIIRNNLIEGVPGDGIVPVGCKGVLVEYNVMKECPGTLPVTEAADGIWPWSCDDAVVQYNIVSDHKSPVDAYGFDSDWNSRNSLFRYNLSYNNDGGFLLICNSGGWEPDWNFGNTGTVAMYNISINDGIRNYKLKEEYFSPVVHCTGPVKNTLIENNLFYLIKKPSEKTDKTLISLTDWNGYPDSTIFSKNYIFTEEPYLAYNLHQSTSSIFKENSYFGPLFGMKTGFTKKEGVFDENFWNKDKDENWEKMKIFIKNKSIPLEGKEMKVTDIIGIK
jgi:hypothetical protein